MPTTERSADFAPFGFHTGAVQFPADVLLLAEELRAELAPSIQVLQPLGSGGMAHVFLGRDPLLKRLVAVKVLAPALANDDVARTRFVREAEAGAAVSHPNVVGVYLVGELKQSRLPYFVMQFVDGRTLSDEMKAEGSFSEARARRLIGEVASALAVAHARGLVHRDIKPANILIEEDTGRAVVVDFGISATLEHTREPKDQRLTQAGTYLGTPMYMSPEQASGSGVTEKSDIYSLGAVAFELLVGRPPFSGTPVAVMASHLKEEAPSVHWLRPDIDPHLAELVDRCLAKDSTKRPTAPEIASSLLPSTRTLVEWPPPGLELLPPQWRRALNLVVVICGLVLSLFLIIATQPTLSSAQWREGEQSRLWSNLLKPGIAMAPITSSELRWQPDASASPDVTPAWAFLIGVIVASIVGLACVAAVRLWQFGRSLYRAAAVGYPMRTCLDAAFDERGDVGEALNGTGRYALMSPVERAQVVALRRLRGTTIGAALMATSMTPIAWMAGLTFHDSGTLVEAGDLLFVFAPVLAGIVVVAMIDFRLRAAQGLLPMRRFAVRRMVGREVVRSWLRSAGLPTRRSRRQRWLAFGTTAAGGTVVIALAYASLIVFTVAFMSAAGIYRYRGEAEAWLAAFSRDSAPPMSFRELDSLLAASAVRPVPSQDTAAAKVLLGRSLMLSATTAAAEGLNADLNTAREIAATWADNSLPSLSPTVFLFIRDGGRLTTDMIDELRAYGQSPWLPWWRRFAHSSSLPPLWVWKPGLPGVRYPWERPFPGGSFFRDLAQRNAAAGYFALVASDPVEAELRARENIAAGRHLFRGTTSGEQFVGFSVVGIGRSQLDVIARRTQNAALAAEAERIRAALQRWRSEGLSIGAWHTLLADPADPPGLRYVNADRSPAVTAQLLPATIFAYCRNAREILFGIDPRRRDLLRRITLSADVPRIDELSRLVDNFAVELQRGTLPAPRALPPIVPLGWIGLGELRDRIAYCVWATSLF